MFLGKPVLPPGREISVSTAIFGTLLLTFLVATRFALAPRYLYYFDSANFALAMERFNPALHQPQPPGYPLFVGLMRVIHLVVESPERVLLIAGLVAACVATLLIFLLGQAMFTRATGVLAATLLASNPVFWFGGLTNQVRMFLSVSALGVAALGWTAITHRDRPVWLYATFAALGIGAGFRPVEAVLLVPLVIWVWWRCGGGVRRLAIGVVVLAATSAPWLAVTLTVVGGPARMWSIVQDYANSQFQGSSMLYGAQAPAAWQMFRSTVVWHVLGGLVWIWAIPFAWRRPEAKSDWERWIFLALACVPPFLFSAIVHIGDPDQGLASVSILSLVGGAAMAGFLRKIGSARVYTTAAALLAAHTVLFFMPPSRVAKASSYRAVKAVDRMTTGAISKIKELSGDGPVTIVHYGSPVASRQIEYYFPKAYLDVLPGSPGRRVSNEGLLVFHDHVGLQPPPGTGIIGKGSRRLLCLVPGDADLRELQGWTAHGPVFSLDRIPKEGVQLGPYRLLWQ